MKIKIKNYSTQRAFIRVGHSRRAIGIHHIHIHIHIHSHIHILIHIDIHNIGVV